MATADILSANVLVIKLSTAGSNEQWMEPPWYADPAPTFKDAEQKLEEEIEEVPWPPTAEDLLQGVVGRLDPSNL